MFFFSRLAAINIRKNSKLYLPYFLTCVGTIMMFYIMLFITTNDGVAKMPGADALSVILFLGSIVIGIFSVIILFYTNSFLIKQRKKELGLYNILGMEKKHIARIMAMENIYVAFFSLLLGLGAGILLSKLMLMILFKLLDFKVPFGFQISPTALVTTLLLFTGIFTLTLIRNLTQVHLANPIELLRGGNTGEKEPKTKWLLTLFGTAALATGYTIAIVTKSPLDALALFFVAVMLVIIGTYCLFTAGSIAFLKILRKNKSFYYKTKHFTSISGMLYRMKQNAVGLANICILSTMVLVMVSTTVSLFIGLDDELRNQYPRNIEIESRYISASDTQLLCQKIEDEIAKSGIPVKNTIQYRYGAFSYQQQGSLFTFVRRGAYTGNNNAVVFFIPLSEYNRMQGASATLSANELMVYSPNAEYTGTEISFNDMKYQVRSKIITLNVQEYLTTRFADTYYFIVPDEKCIEDIYNHATPKDHDWKGLSWYFGVDVDGDSKTQIALSKRLTTLTQTIGAPDIHYETLDLTCAESNKDLFLGVYGGLFFLGMFLGTLFIMATVLIMYYKQISEGYDDKSRFEIMQKVGMSHNEVKEAIRSQVLTVFFLPILVAGIHIAAAFSMITRLLAVLNLTNVALFARCTIGTLLVFTLFYAIVYALTARVYYRIVE